MTEMNTKNNKKSIFKIELTKKATIIFDYKFPKRKSMLLAPISLNSSTERRRMYRVDQQKHLLSNCKAT